MMYYGVEVSLAKFAETTLEYRKRRDEVLDYGARIAVPEIIETIWWLESTEKVRVARMAERQPNEQEWKAYIAHFSDALGNPKAFIAAGEADKATAAKRRDFEILFMATGQGAY
jgi:hypothetical protein